MSVYSALWQTNRPGGYIAQLAELAEEMLTGHNHGDLPRWRAALAGLPATSGQALLDGSMPRLGAAAQNQDALADLLMTFHPWRKGPLALGGVEIDTEWRSDWKWNRLAGQVDVRDHDVLDIGCGNGYFGWRMLGAGARQVIGIDPTLVFVMQWLACRHFAGELPNYVLPLGIEDLPVTADAENSFDSVFSMGVLYHRRDPEEHLGQIFNLVKPAGQAIVETLVLPDSDPHGLLVPENRYARMRNVWAIPGVRRLERWLVEAGFVQPRLLDISPTTVEEQRSTRWMRFESLAESLDPDNPERTQEGYPAPVRAVFKVIKPTH